MSEKSRLKAEWAWFLSEERRAKPETEQAFASLGQKLRVFRTHWPELFKRFS
jgi:hypothetical protein